MNLYFQKVNKSNLVTAVAILVLIIIADIYLLKEIINIVYPIGDEFSLIVESQKSPINWIKEGFGNYFNVYEEYFTPYTNFVRPVANLIYRLFSYTPHPLIYQLIAVNYLAHGMLCALIYVLSIAFNNTNKFSLAVAFAGFLAPAFWLTPMIESPSFSLDGVATILSLISLIALIKKKLFLGIFFLIASVFTKETALPINVVWVLVGLQQRDSRIFILGVFSLSLWFLIRILAFNSLVGGTYSFNEFSINGLIFRLGALATLPLGNFSIETLKEFILNNKINYQLLYLVINFVVWLLSLKIIFESKSQLMNPSKFFKHSDDSIIILIAFIGSISYYCFIGGSVRFSYLTYILWLIVLSSFGGIGIKRLILFILICSSAVSFLFKSYKVSEVDEYYYHQSEILVNYLQKNRFNGTTYVVNDFIGRYARQENVVNFSGSKSTFLRGSSISFGSCNISEIKQIKNIVTVDTSGNKRIKIYLPNCAAFVFEGASTKKILDNISGISLHRNDEINYIFDNLEIKKTKFGGNPYLNFGNQMEVIVSSGVHVLYFDFYKNNWIFLE